MPDYEPIIKKMKRLWPGNEGNPTTHINGECLLDTPKQLVTVFLDFLMGDRGYAKVSGWHGVYSPREQEPGVSAHWLCTTRATRGQHTFLRKTMSTCLFEISPT